MKKNLLVTIGLLLLFNFCLDASNLYWVGGTGAWNDASHWSLVSGGAGGTVIPAGSDDVFFDAHSFSDDKQTVMLTVDGACRSINWSGIDKNVIFSSARARTLTVNGSYALSPLLSNGFKGQTVFAGTTSGNRISTAGVALIGNWVFNGTGSWLLADDVNAPAANISLAKGTLNTNDKKIICNNFSSNSSQSRTLNLTSSEILINNVWDCSDASNLILSAASSRIMFADSLDTFHFRSGGLAYGSVSAVASGCTPSGTACANFTISLTGTNVICNGFANGTANATVTGGSGTFTFFWSPAPGTGQGTPNVTGLGAGTYTVKVTDSVSGLFCFCSIQITEPGVLFDFEIVTTKPLCNGQCNGSSVVDATGGTPGPGGYNYSWTGGAGTNDTVLNLCAGTYTVTVIDSRGCTGSTTILVAQPAVLAVPGSFTNVVCNAACNGTATVAPTGGTTPYGYNWTPGNPTGDGTPSITGLCPGSYSCTVTDAHSCIATFTTNITQPPILNLAVSHANVDCGSASTGTATATVSGGVSPYTYVWSNGSSLTTASTTNTISGLPAGTYIIQLTDANGCSKIDSVIITQPAVLLASATGVNISCFGLCDGTAHAIVTGGTPVYNYNWTPGNPIGDGTPNVSGLCPGTYTVTVGDTHGCSDTGIVVITQPALLTANPTSVNELCFGDCNGTATAAPAGGTAPYNYNWTPGNPPGDGTPTITSLCTGTYNVVVTDAHGCDTIQTVTVTQPTILNVVISKMNVTCNGACNGNATANPSGGTPGYSYSWSPGGATTPTITGLCPGTYTVTVKDANNCIKTATVTITQPNPLNVTINSTTIACNGDCNATAGATVTGGTATFSFNWLPAGLSGGTTNTVSSLCAGVYTVNVTDLNGCPATANVTISQPTPLTVVSSSTDVTCFGLCNGTASVIAGGGTPGYTYSWAPGGQITPSITGLCAGTYTVTVKDANGCMLTNTVIVNTPTQVLGNPVVASNVTCAGLCNGSAASSAIGGSGGYTYNWLPGTPAGDGTPTITGLCAGSYTLVTTDGNGCTSSQPVIITQPAVLSAPITGSTSSCNVCNGTATVTAAGGTPPYNYSWAPGGQSTPTAIGLCPNMTYTVTVTDAHGCTASSVVTIMQTITITITTSNTTLSCAGACDGIATANAGGGLAPYNYLWVDSTGTVSTSQTATGLCAGSYTVTVVDANGCLNTAIVVFTNPPVLSVSATHTNATCGGSCNGTANGTASGGNGAFTYLWMPGGQTTAAVSGLCAGTYTFTATDAGGCSDTAIVTVTEPTLVLDNVTITDANCLLADGSITVAPTGGSGSYTYVWSGPGALTGQGTPSLINLLPGAYSLVITDGSSCSFTFSYILNNVNGPNLTMAHTNVTCHNACNGTATVTASGGAGGYLYNWTPGNPTGDGTNAVISLCGTTTYTITVTDVAGCIRLDTATVNNPTLISPNPVVVNESCGGSCNGSITLNTTGGTPGYSYAWSPGGATTPTISGLCAGSYTVIVTDTNGCDSTLIITITAPPMLVVTLSSTNVRCAFNCDGTATATPSGGSGSGYSYSWTNQPPAIVLPNIVNLCPNQYIVTLTDGNGCTAKDTVNITEPPPLFASTSQVNASCNGVCDGIAIVTATGGTIPYGYSWSPGAISNDTASGLCAGSYNPVVTDANGCASTPPPVVITQPGAIVPAVTTTNSTCNSACNGTATAAPTGGTAPYTYNWSPGVITGQGTPNATALCAGAYVLTITDSLGCARNQNITLIDPPTLNANPTSTSPTCNNSCNGTVTATPVGGTAGYTYSWSPGAAITPIVSGLCPATYTVIVTDTKNCKDTQTVVVANPPQLSIVSGSTPANCGVCNGSITISPITGQTPYTYVWSPAVTGQGTPNGTNICAGLYNITVTDANGCDSTFIIPMNNSGGVTGETVSTIDVSCNSFCNGSGSVVPIGGVAPFNFLWNNGPPPTANDTATSLCAGNYFVQITDSNTCIHFSPVTINQPAPILSNASITSAICSNVCTGAISLATTGGTPGYTYVWTPGAITGQGTANVTGLCPGTYTVVITDAHLCTKTDSFTVTQSAPLAATIGSTNISCSNVCNGTAHVTITSGTAPYNIQWNDAAGQTNDTATALCAGNYSVTITDANGCSVTLNTTITATPPVAANPVITDATCGVCNGSAVLTPSGGAAPYNYLWSNGQTTATATNLCSGLYTVNITDANGCVNSAAIPVNNTSGPTGIAITATNVTCNGSANGAVTGVTPSGGTPPYTYFWIAGGQTTATLSGLSAGIYFVEVTDSSGCSRLDSVTITQPAAILANQTITAAACGVCDGTITIAPSGGMAPYTILWNTGSTALTLTNLCAGIYSVQITDANGCVVNVVIPLSNFNASSLAITSTNISCNAFCNGTATVVATGGTAPYAYSWNDLGLQTTPVATALCAGNYAVEVTGANGCVAVGTVSLTQPTPIVFSLVNATNPLCNGDTSGTITVIPSGGTLAYSYAWTPSGGSGLTATGLTANTYTVTVTDGNGCTATQSTVLSQTTALTISSTSVNPSCNTIADGSIDVTVGGGTSTYSYQWSGGSTAITEDLSGILGGTYTVNVTDGNGCTVSDTTVLTPSQSVIAAAGNDTSFCQNGSIVLNASGSVNGVNYQWFEIPANTSVGNTSNVSVAPPIGITDYYVMVDNGTGCTDNDTITVISNALPTASAGPDVSIVIAQSTPIGGSPTTTASGATAMWTPLPGLDNATAFNPIATPVTTTLYTVTITSAQGCIASDSVLVTVLPTIKIPDGISPNNDGDNDEWLIDGIEMFPNCTVEVYNRWGELLFQSPGYKEHWKGVYKGKDLPVGTYYYIIDLGDPLFPDAYTGPITILR
ncbi:MAG: hypothetical protein JWP12_649 [Bacteroidetes bacterium]|nr:hypothetical protein [Bacteroidota bacterium]